MDEAFVRLNELVDDHKVVLAFRKRLDHFSVWAHCLSKFSTSTTVALLSTVLFWLYWVVSSIWIWLLVGIILSFTFNIKLLSIVILPIAIRFVFRRVGLVLLTVLAKSNIRVFDYLWASDLLGIYSTEKYREMIRESENLSELVQEEMLRVTPIERPAFMIIPQIHRDWRNAILKGIEKGIEAEKMRSRGLLEAAFRGK